MSLRLLAMTLIDQIIRIVRTRQRRGARFAELSPHNLAVLGMRRAPASQEQHTVPQQFIAQQPGVPQPSVAPSPPMTPVAVAPAVPPPAPPPHAPVAFPAPPDVRNADWDALCQACRACQSCGLCATRHSVVIEDGCRTAPLMFIGEGPGADEDAQGVPFVGRAGQLLTRMIGAMGRDRASDDPAKAVYIANIVKCRPPGNRNPLPEEGQACVGYLHRQIALVQPKVIVLLGNVALKFLTGRSGIMGARGKWIEVQGIPAMPTFHPSYVIRFERDARQFHDVKLQVWQDLQQVMRRLAETPTQG